MSNSGLSKARLERVRDMMHDYVARGEIPGLVALISRKGETHVEAIGTLAAAGREPVRRDSIFRIASMTKPVTAAAAMILVEECKLRLDDPVDRLLPELANRKVLKRLDGAVDETVPAKRAITLRDLLTFRAGYGMIMAMPGQYPIQAAIVAAGFAPGPNPAPFGPDEYMKRLGQLPLVHQPGEQWLYHTGSDVLGVLIARAAGQTLDVFMRERIFAPLGMKDTGFSVPASEAGRFATSYGTNGQTGAIEVHDDPKTGLWSKPPLFEAGGGGLVSTADDFLAFGQMLLNKGKHRGLRILSRPTVETMMSDQLTAAQKAVTVWPGGFFDARGWGFGMAVATRRINPWEPVGQCGWDGGLGSSWRCDPSEEMTTILLTQRAWSSPVPPPAFFDFWATAYQAIDD